MRRFAASLGFLLFTLPLAAADFGFSVVIQAGDNIVVPNQFEIGIGASGGPITYSNLSTNFLSQPGPRNFAIGYRNTTNTAFLRIYDGAGATWQEVTYSPAGGGVPATERRWDLPGSGFNVSALANSYLGNPLPGGVVIDQLALSSSLSVLQPLSAASLSASQTGVTSSTTNLASTVSLKGSAVGTAGDWTLTGRITFSGLSVLLGPANRLRFGLDAGGTNTPEPGTFAMIGLALIFLNVFRRSHKTPSGLKRSA